MRRISIYAFGLSAGIVGFFAGLFAGIEWLDMDKPQLSYFAIAAAVVFAIGGVAISARTSRTVKGWSLAVLCGTGLTALIVTQTFFWLGVSH